MSSASMVARGAITSSTVSCSRSNRFSSMLRCLPRMKLPLSSTAVRISSGVRRVEAMAPAPGILKSRKMACTNRFTNHTAGVASHDSAFRIPLASSASGSG
jgi:hypothetical protein